MTRTVGRALMGQFEVIHALVMRETRTRFGAHQLGYLWALVEPSLMILTFFVLFKIGKRVPPFGMDIFPFIATGIIPFLLFSHSVNKVAESINGNKALLFYPQVKPLDLVMARMTLEFCTFSGVFMILLGSNVLYRQELAISDPLLIVMSFVLASALGGSLGLVFCGLSQISKVAERARGPLMRPFFWLSGIFFAANALTGNIRELMLYNPVLHVVELCRGGWFPGYDPVHADPFYVVVWILGLAFVGLSLERVVRRRIEVT